MFDLILIVIALGLIAYWYFYMREKEPMWTGDPEILKTEQEKKVIKEYLNTPIKSPTYVPPVRAKPFANNASAKTTYVAPAPIPVERNDSSNLTSASLGYIAGSVISSMQNREPERSSYSRPTERYEAPEPSYSSHSDSSGSSGGGSSSSWDSSSSSSDSGGSFGGDD